MHTHILLKNYIFIIYNYYSVNRASRLSNFWKFSGAIQMISCRARLVTMDETWLYHYDPETKQQSMEWRHSCSPRPPKIPSAKIGWKSSRLVFFWDQDGILLVDYLPKDQTLNAQYYSSLLVQLKDILKEKRRGKFTKGVLLLHDNAPSHRALATQKKLTYLGFQCLDHPPYSPDLAPSDYHLFPGLKKTIERSPFRPTRRSLLPWRSGWTDKLLNFFEWLAKVGAMG